ncbi:MAG: AmmeMemoRadiSam system radical SAM enzyme [Deltaproteobacteria bacterium]|nr:AmmeMemoRadiSam system radical SAM enzyme [Candidatus Zymogenaceae bacterium]
MHHSELYKKIENRKIACRVCMKRCIIPEGGRGWCKTRLNKGGKLFSLIYGRVAAMMVSPIEKKPMYHFHPGSSWLSVGSVGCNFRCPGCQNWETAHGTIDVGGDGGFCVEDGETQYTEYLAPRAMIEIAVRERTDGISFTYNEPTLWIEYATDCMEAARKAGLLTNWVTNGYLTVESLDLIGPWLDSFRVDIKGFSQKTYRSVAGIDDFRGIMDICVRAKRKWDMHVELVTNIIPGRNDDPEELSAIARWIARELGDDTPWHVTRFHPHRDLLDVKPTPVDILESVRERGLAEGLRYVYIGNVPGHSAENTYCPSCGSLIIRRRMMEVLENHLENGACPQCHAPIPGRFDRTFR